MFAPNTYSPLSAEYSSRGLLRAVDPAFSEAENLYSTPFTQAGPCAFETRTTTVLYMLYQMLYHMPYNMLYHMLYHMLYRMFCHMLYHMLYQMLYRMLYHMLYRMLYRMLHHTFARMNYFGSCLFSCTNVYHHLS